MQQLNKAFVKTPTVLNNCGLYLLVPEIKHAIMQFSLNPRYNNQYQSGYNQLKDLFAEYYELTEFTWPQFAAILQQYNLHDTQIILGPVLRKFMQINAATDDLTQIDPETGRYLSLSIQELHTYVGQYLGFTLIDKTTDIDDVFKTKNQIDTIEFYHEGGDGAQNGGHWTRKQSNKLQINNNIKNQLDLILTLFNDDPMVNPAGFCLLKQHVKLTMHVAESFKEINLKAKQLNNQLMKNMADAENCLMSANEKTIQDFLNSEHSEKAVVVETSINTSHELQNSSKFSTIDSLRKILQKFDENIQKFNANRDPGKSILVNLLNILRHHAQEYQSHDTKDEFLQKCRQSIGISKRSLENNLWWQHYLINLLKSIANAVINVISFGQCRTFFAYNKPALTITLETVENDLSTIDKVC